MNTRKPRPLGDRDALLSNRLLHLILMPTEQCNFRCVYCYEDFAGRAMTRRVIESVKALMDRRIRGLDLLSVEWFGGEPLLVWPIVDEIQSHARELTRANKGVRLAGSMTTNGALLTCGRFRRLLTLGVTRFQITLDGAREHHDAIRRRQGGGGSFRSIWRNLLAMRPLSQDFEVLLRLHMTRTNLGSLEELLGELAATFGSDRRFPLMFKAVRRFGGPNDESLPVLSRDREQEVLDRLCGKACKLGLTLQQRPFEQNGILQGCYAAALGSYVVRSNGDLAKCTVALRHANNRIGTLQRDGTVVLDAPKMTGWIRGALRGDRAIMQCPMKGWADPASGGRLAGAPASGAMQERRSAGGAP